jgi:hypothetical protein
VHDPAAPGEVTRRGWRPVELPPECVEQLLFDHKYPYLRATRGRYDDSSLTRMFCTPQRAVTGSPLYERLLLLLAVALMEATGIQVQVCDDPAYSDAHASRPGLPDRRWPSPSPDL